MDMSEVCLGKEVKPEPEVCARVTVMRRLTDIAVGEVVVIVGALIALEACVRACRQGRGDVGSGTGKDGAFEDARWKETGQGHTTCVPRTSAASGGKAAATVMHLVDVPGARLMVGSHLPTTPGLQVQAPVAGAQLPNEAPPAEQPQARQSSRASSVKR